MANIQIKGLKEVSQKLKKLPKNIRNRHVGKALRAGGKLVRDEARLHAPVATGLVRKNVAMRTSTGARAGRNADVKVRIGIISDKTGRETGTDAFYWRFHEFGTSKMPAQPFLRPAFEGKKGQVLNTIVRQLRTGIRKEARRVR